MKATRQGGRERDFRRDDFSNIGTVQMDDFTATQLPGHNRHLPSQGTVWDLIPGTRDNMYPHQRDGFEFIWKNIGGNIYIDKAKKCISDGGGHGCIISHAPGTGKTRLTITFIKAYMLLNPDCRPLIIAPCTVLLTWEQQFKKWNVGLPFHNLNTTEYSGKETATAVNLLKNCRQSSESIRLVKLLSWTKEKSVLGIGYQLFEELANAKVHKNNNQIGEIREILFKLPGLLVLDEGHIPRSEDSKVWKALLKVQTERRIMLSGTPFQNNFQELLNTFCLARPSFLEMIMSQNHGKSREKWIRIKNATREKWDSMTVNISKDEKKMKDFKGMIKEFVHVYKGTVLKENLPGITDFAVVLSPKDLQKELIEMAKSRKNSFVRDHIMSLIAVHPALILSCSDSSENQKL